MKGNEAGDHPRKMIWSGRVLIVLTASFMLLDGAMKIVKPPQVLEAKCFRLAYPISALSGIGMALIACTLIYLIPRTSILGAVLLTGYLGGGGRQQRPRGLRMVRDNLPGALCSGCLEWPGIARSTPAGPFDR